MLTPPPKLFVLDTNVLVHDPEALHKFEDNTVIIPMTVIEELDGLKKGMNEVGRNAREVTRKLDLLREEGGRLHEGVKLDSGGTLQVYPSDATTVESMPNDFPDNIKDNRIIAVALHLHKEECGKALGSQPVILISKDTNVRVKANTLGITAQDYRNDKVNVDELYTGAVEVLGTPEDLEEFNADGAIAAPKGHSLLPNQCVTLINAFDMKGSLLGRYHAPLDLIVKISRAADPMDLVPRNREQTFALDLLMDPDIPLVTLVGKAGTGKTLLAIAAGLHGAMDTDRYTKVLVYRPVTPLGKQDIGFLPGDELEKLNPWMQPIFDNIEVLMGGRSDDADYLGHKSKFGARRSPVEELTDLGKLEVGGLYGIRGRSLPNMYLIVDETQNLTPHDIKTIITRAGEGTKIVLTGDPYQIDNPYVDSCSNGLTYAVEKFKDQQLGAHLTLFKGERSALAEVAAEVL